MCLVIVIGPQYRTATIRIGLRGQISNKKNFPNITHCDKNISCDVKGTTTIVILTKIKEPHIRR